jgi:K+-transporting ATPase c subunit
MSEEHEAVATVAVDPAPVEQKTDEELLAEKQAEEAAAKAVEGVEADRLAAEVEAEAKIKADEEARIEADRIEVERLATEEAAKTREDEDVTQTSIETRELSVNDEDKINLLQMLEGFTDERHSIHVRLYEMIPFLDGAIAKSDGLLKHILTSLSDVLR